MPSARANQRFGLGDGTGELTYEIAYDEPDYHYPSGFMHRMEVTPGLTMTENTGVARTSPISCDRCHIIVEG